jgi:hypothetical protein
MRTIISLLPIWSRTVHGKLIVTHLVKNVPAFIEPEGSVPSSQQPIAETYPEPDESSPHPNTLLAMHLFLHYRKKSALPGGSNFTREA